MRAFLLLGLLTTMLLGMIPAAPAAAVAQVTLDLSNCSYLESVNFIPGALVDPLIPDDFQVSAAPQTVVGMAQCDALASDGRSDRVTFGWADVTVNPRSALRTPGITLYLYRIEHLAMNDLYGELHRQIGAECRVLDGSDVLVRLLDTHAIGTVDGASVWDIRVPAGLPADGGFGETPYREYGLAHGGYAFLQGTLVNPGAQILPGSFMVDEESPLFGVWGPAWPSAIQFAEGFRIDGTEIGLVPWEGAPAPRATC